jgi:hypothetical protein
MAKAKALKVYRTPIGFHDAYVAAPSQKAALAAWGSDANLFARGVAEQVTDPMLIGAALAEPGKVIKRLRGTAEEQIAALPQGMPEKPKRRTVKSTTPTKPRPSRDVLDAAEQTLAKVEAEHQAQLDDIRNRERALAAERQQLEALHAKKRKGFEADRDRARLQFEKAMRRWRA